MARFVVRQDHFRVQLESLERMNLGAHIVHDSQAADSFDQLVFFQGMRRTGQDVQTNSAPRRRAPAVR